MVSNIAKYLKNYAQPAATQLLAQLPALNSKPSHHALVIPCYSESEHALEQVFANLNSPALKPTLAVAVINAPHNASVDKLQQTRRHLVRLQSQLVNKQLIAPEYSEPESHPMQLGQWQHGSKITLLVVDCCSTDQRLINPKQGVGLARKLGADLALAFIHQNLVQQPWIYSTDADAVLPADYFDYQPKDTAALSLPFVHQAMDPELQHRSQLYEAHMRAYASRLAASGSPYGYLSLGSALACSAEHYAQVRGFPKRNAGEDFYLLNKLAKTGAIVSPNSTPIRLNARYSDRVPFGTGPALQHWPSPGAPVTTYPDQAFTLLAALIRLFKHCSISPRPGVALSFEEGLAQLGDPISATVAGLDPKNELGKIFAKNVPAQVRYKAAHDWFDALKTLRFVRLVSKRFAPLELGLA